MSRKTPVSLCMIANNEEAFIGAALESVKAALCLDDMIVVDTGSDDNTKEIAAGHGAKVFDFEWRDDFSAARNFGAEKAANDWILVLDADEEVIGADIPGLRSFIKDASAVGQIEMIEMSDREHNRISRLYNRKNSGYEGRIHEQVTPRANRRAIRKEAPIRAIHHGYLPEIMQGRGKLERNEKLLLEELESSPYDSYLLFQLGKNFFIGGRDLAKACDYFEKALSCCDDPRLDYIYATVECYGYALINTGQYAEALALREKYAKQYGGITQFRFLSAHIYQNSGMLVEAVECYESCIGAGADDYKGITSYLSYYNIGVILECVGMKEDAMKMYENCGDYEPAKARLAEMQGKQ